VRRDPSRLAMTGASISAALLAIGLVFVAPSSTPFPGGILPVTGALGILFFLHGRQSRGILLALLEHKIARFLGKISYSLYLWHWPVFALFRWTVGLQSAIAAIAASALAFALSVASYYFVETPPRRALAVSRLPRVAAVGIGLAALAAGYGVTGGIWSLRTAISLSTVTRNEGDWYPDGADTNPTFPGCKIALTKTRFSGDYVRVYSRTGCSGSPTALRNLFVIGDSHASAYESMIKGIVLQTGDQVFLYGAGGCSFIGLLYPSPPQCDAFSNAAIADILTRIQPRDLVFLPSLRLPQFVSYGEDAAKAVMFAPQTAKFRDAEIEAAIPLLKSLTAKELRWCLKRLRPFSSAPPFVSRRLCVGSTSDPVPGQRLLRVRDGRPLFFDGDHLSGFANELLLPSFLAFAEGLEVRASSTP
jgi:SGNH domain (fused to AT3 domains)